MYDPRIVPAHMGRSVANKQFEEFLKVFDKEEYNKIRKTNKEMVKKTKGKKGIGYIDPEIQVFYNLDL